MNSNLKFTFFLIIILFAVGTVHAADFNSTETEQLGYVINDTHIETGGLGAIENSSDSHSVEKSHPIISIDSNNIKSKDVLNINLVDSTGNVLKFKNITAKINNKNFKLVTNSKGVAKLNVNLPAGKYKLTIQTREDDNFKATSKTFNLKLSKISTSIIYQSNFVLNNNYFYSFLKDENGNGISSKKITLILNGKTYVKKTNVNGRIAIKIKSSSKKLSIYYKFDGDDYYFRTSKKVNFYVNEHTSLNIGNSKLITGGYLRIYLKGEGYSSYWKKTITVTVGNLKFSKKTNAEGIVIIRPNMDVGKYKVSARYGKYYTFKIMYCYKAIAKDPLKEVVPLKNGAPDIDVMTGNYVGGDGSRTYILTKSQYMEVLKRDSQCLFLKNKLTKYVFFKTKHYPNTYHILNREKWNVIEKAINEKLVDANTYGYWPGIIKVSLKGRSYSYPEVRDWQDTAYTCGPTSCSMCSQVLKNYLCEAYIAKYAHSTKAFGTSCSDMSKVLEKKNFKCEYYYRNSFAYALNELKKGGCALVFHARNHYVAILDISTNGKLVLVSNSYGTYDNIASKWLSVSYMKTRYYKNYDDGLIVRLNYNLNDNIKNQISCYYSNFVPNWAAHNTRETVS
ncbi:hypothetical protein [uncultured Methanobrevibacter sp.]|uniref:hypothetical protein n=1 Tax=uncultured Methanobrevibacter sp. TaxID=253161 RepID=UPI002600D2DD|nr:hypothetical protein [uncultured Methanobrevibacter sp.]